MVSYITMRQLKSTLEGANQYSRSEVDKRMGFDELTVAHSSSMVWTLGVRTFNEHLVQHLSVIFWQRDSYKFFAVALLNWACIHLSQALLAEDIAAVLASLRHKGRMLAYLTIPSSCLVIQNKLGLLHHLAYTLLINYHPLLNDLSCELVMLLLASHFAHHFC